jgi:O-antigen/teichoic acid export membrane protein
MAGARELGLYSVAVSWGEGLFLLPTALSFAQRPDLVRTGRSTAGKQAAQAFRMATLLTIPMVLFILVAAPFLCVTVFGPEFQGSIDDLRVLAAGAFGIAAVKLLGSALIAQSKPLLEMVATTTAFVLTITLDILLIPTHGGLGAALASAIAYSAGGLAVGAIASRTLAVPLQALVPRLSDAVAAGAVGRGVLRRVVRGGASA